MCIYIYIYMLQLSEHQVRGRRAVSDAGLQGRGSHKGDVLLTGTGKKAEMLGGAPRSFLKSGGLQGVVSPLLALHGVKQHVFIEVGAYFSWGYSCSYENRP